MRTLVLLSILSLLSSLAFAQTKVSELSGWAVETGKLTKVKEGTKAASVTVPLPGLLQADADFVIPEVVYDANGRVVRSAEGVKPLRFRGVNGFLFRADRYSLGPRGLHLSGALTLPEALGGQTVTVPRGQAYLEPDGSLIIDPFKGSLEWKNGKLVGRAEWLSVSRNGLTLGAGTVLVAGDKNGLAVGAATFGPDGSLVNADAVEPTGTLKVNGLILSDLGGSRITELRYTTNDGHEVSGLRVSFGANVHLPPPLQEASSYYQELVFVGDGRVSSEGDRDDYRFEYQGVEFSFPRPRFSSDEGFLMDEVSIQLSPAMGGSTIGIDSLKLTPAGQYDLWGFSTGPINFWGLKVTFNQFAFTDKGFVGRSGWARVDQRGDSDFPIHGFEVKTLEVDYDGRLARAELGSVDPFALNDVVELQDGTIMARQSAPGAPLSLAVKGGITLWDKAGAWPALEATLPFDATNKVLKLEELRIAPLVLDRGGLRLRLDAVIADQTSLRFQGTATVLAAVDGLPPPGPQGYVVTELVWSDTGETLTVQGPGPRDTVVLAFDGAWKVVAP